MNKRKLFIIFYFAAFFALIVFNFWFFSRLPGSLRQAPNPDLVERPGTRAALPAPQPAPAPGESFFVDIDATEGEAIGPLRWGRNPFFTADELHARNRPAQAGAQPVRRPTASAPPPLELNGVIVFPNSRERSLAIINQHYYGIGQFVGDEQVLDITSEPKSVVLVDRQGRSRRLTARDFTALLPATAREEQ